MSCSSICPGNLKVLFSLVIGWLTIMAVSSQAQIVTLNVTNFGAVGDCADITVSVSSNSPVVITTNRFTSADVGKVMCLFGAGYYATLSTNGHFNGSYGNTPTNHQDMVVTIRSVSNGTNVTISSICGVTTNNILCTYGTQNMMAFSNCIAAAPTNPTTIYIPTGNYLLIPPTALDTNYIQAGIFYSSPTITIRRGGLHFLGDGTNLTILTGNGAWQQKGIDCAYRGYMFSILGPITNDTGPLIFDNMQLNGNAARNHGPYTYWPAVPTDGSGWDNSHHAFVDSGSPPWPAYRSFTNCLFCHWHGETIYTPGGNWDGMVDVGSCTFMDGNATALNVEITHNYHNNLFSDYYQVEEFYQSWASNTCYFESNFATNIYNTGIAVCGAITNRRMSTYNIVGNTFYMNGDPSLEISPAQNVNFAENYIDHGWMDMPSPGYQGNAQSSNIFIGFNTFSNMAGLNVFADLGSPDNTLMDSQFTSNTVLSASVQTIFGQMYGNWVTNVSFSYNTMPAGTGAGLISTNGTGQYFIDDLSNQFPPYQQTDNTGKTNVISYGFGIRQVVNATVANSIWVLDDTHPAQVPPGAILQITSSGSFPATLYSSASMSGTPIVLTNGETANYLWTNGAWANDSSTTNPPVNPAIQVSAPSLPLGTILSGTSVTGSFTVQNVGGGTLSGTASVGPPFTIVSGGTYTLSANASQTVTVSFNPTSAGSYSQSVTLTGGGGATVGVSGSATNVPVPTPVLQVTPGNIAYGTILNGTSKTNSFTVQNIGTGTLTGTASVGAPFSVVSGGSYSLGASASQTVTVAFSPTGASNYNQSVTFTGGNGASSTVTGSATNAPVPTPVLQVTPGSIAYGTILNGTSKTNSFTVQNIGTGTLTGTASVGAPFSIVSGGRYSLGAGASQLVTVVFSPVVASNYNQSVIFTGGNGTNTTVTGSATNTPPVLPMVSAISVNATDVDLSLPGLQIYAGTTVQFSAKATNAQTWQWSYAVNGGTPVVWTNGTSPITNISCYFDTNTIGNSYVWTLVVSNSQGWAESQTNLEVEAQPLGTTNTGLIFTATNGVLSGMLMANTVINGVPSSYIYLPPPAPGYISSGTAVFNFTVATAGNYEIQALVDAPNTSANSFAVNIDGAPQDPAMIWDILPITSGFQQRIVNWRGSGTANSDQFVPKVFGLSAGAHQIYFKGEEPGTALAIITLLQVIPSPPSPPITPDGLRVVSP